MKRRAVGRLTVLTIGLWLGGVMGADRTAEKDATGTWTLVRMREPGSADARPSTLKMKQEGDKITGTITVPGRRSVEIQDGRVTDGRITFFIQPEPDAPKSYYTGALAGDTIKGKVEHEINGKKRPGPDWKGERVADQ